MSKKFTPENVKQEFYNKYSSTSNYKDLTIFLLRFFKDNFIFSVIKNS